MQNALHLYHIPEESPWPLCVAIGSFFFVSGLAFFVHRIFLGTLLLFWGVLTLLLSAIMWFSDLIQEATYAGEHTQIVRWSLKIGFLLFLASEVMLFFGFFWAFFHSALCPSVELGAVWPPKGLNYIPVFDYPLFNTILLIVSGFSVTWVHRAMAMGSFKNSIDGFIVTISLGLLFIFSQAGEYFDATFNITEGIYPSTFYLLTGLHGFHVIVGIIFLTVCFIRLLQRHFLVNHYSGLVFAMWYWHFVDIVWIALFIIVYLWGSWHTPHSIPSFLL